MGGGAGRGRKTDVRSRKEEKGRKGEMDEVLYSLSMASA